VDVAAAEKLKRGPVRLSSVHTGAKDTGAKDTGAKTTT
jgi:hypothetical protein